MESEYGKIVTLYCEKHKDVKTLTLAKQIFKDHPDDFNSIEQVRSLIRIRRGNKGNRERAIHSKSFNHLYREHKTNGEWAKVETKQVSGNPAKVLIFDIETAPNKIYAWRLWKHTASHEMLLSEWFMLTWAAKWLFEDTVYTGVLTPKEIKKENDKRIVEGLWQLLDEADVVIAHNGDKFDIRMLNTRLLKHGMTSPSPYLSIDTLTHARKRFNIPSNRLDYLGEFLGVGNKMEHEGFKLWSRFLEGDEDAIKKMEDYNIQDVFLLENVYLKLRPFIKPHPNMGLYIEDNISRCPSCGSDDLQQKGTYRTYINNYDSYICKNCGAWSRSRRSNTSLKEFSDMKSSLPK